MNQEFFSVQLSNTVEIAFPLNDMERAIQIQPEQICSLPGIASFWRGVVNYEGSLLWLLNSEVFFNLAPITAAKTKNVTAVILNHQVQGTQRRVALSVKRLKGIVTLEQSLPSQSFPLSLSSHFQSLFNTMVQHNNKTFLLLDTEAFFTHLHSSLLVNS